ncbi:DNA repair protein RecO [Flavobacterium psychrophilum]|jgi:DNA repair protein RecO (recombination protein O)|uniref:DNA repair protein RecO n=3 Tax=Flavobacterium psychrophilum TaxID=96345 RepID=RECO_FLAPJ|nr:DNA repair protein RecO [Flavobacterium psychrophilum]A6GWB0.1 RecName: Full=DNA repair protein RecO; AltName: Full=Recombination protein O [Flavobacterium psychrophilum JIP02/86]AIG29193.1 DNA recombination protein RecO [Flavobacterium psychrophilum]AIG31469.1 DNA recombination protein RecO [Flavobacterium psychrophilum]AIG33626.1 DNA recombination protein RecO [Flavobacterium psychrophilum]AIG35985.1 DNA recombination protein RecO [Flavobacterium psychrophilum]AIG38249.1 DNA recombinatio
MQIKTKAIVISAIKYQEKSLIVKCFTLSDGLKSYFVRDAFSSKKSNQKIAYFQPLTILEIEAVHKNKGTLERFKEVKIATPFHSIHYDVIKSTIVIFISEILHHSIHEEEKNEAFFTFLETALHWLDNHDQIANFHLILLLETTKYLGFYPDISNTEHPFFEMTEGLFSPFHAISSLTEHETNLFKKLIDLKFDNSNTNTLHSTERQILLKILINYYSYHLDGFKKPKSLEVLKEVFS